MGAAVDAAQVSGYAADTDDLTEDARIARARAIFDWIATPDGLMSGWTRVSERSPMAGSDRQPLSEFAAHLTPELALLADEIATGAYRPGGVLRFSVPKKNGAGSRELGLLCVRDRVAQSAMLHAITPIMEAEFEASSHGYRRGRGVHTATAQIASLYRDGWHHVVEADIAGYFDHVPHDRLLACLHTHLPHNRLMRLFDQWLDLSGKPDLGLVQGAPISPILANLYLDDLDEEAAAMGARIVRFADDFVLLAKSREKAERLHVELGKLLAARGLRLNPGKSGVVDFDQGFSFLGRHFLKSMVLEDRYALDEQDWDAALEQALGKERSGGSPSGQELQRRFRNVDFGEATVLSSAPVPADAAPVLADPLWNRRGQDGLRDLEPGVRTLHLHGKGRMLTARDASFVVREGGEELWHCGASRVGRIDIGPHALIADSGLRHALLHDVPVRFVDGRGTTIGWLHGAQSNRAERQLSQARHALDPELCIATAREFVRGKIQNQRGVLQRWLSNARKAERKGAPQRAGLKPLLERSIALLKVEVGKTAGAEARTHLLGIEGAATRIFLQAFRKGLIAWSFGKRQRRPAPDEVNVVLNWLSYLLMRDVEVAIQRHDLHPGFAFLHTTQDYRDALAFDLIEEFRPTCVEALALALFNSAELQSHFFFREPAAGICRLTTDGSSLVVRRFEEWMARDRLSHPDRDKAQNWRGVIDAQVMRLVRAVEGGAAYRAYKVKA